MGNNKSNKSAKRISLKLMSKFAIVILILSLICISVFAIQKNAYVIKVDNVQSYNELITKPYIIYYNLGNSLYQQGELQTAIISYNQALKIINTNILDKDNIISLNANSLPNSLLDYKIKILHNLALIYYKTNNLQKAIETQTSYLSLQQEDIIVQNDLAVMIVEDFRNKENSEKISKNDLENLKQAKVLFEQIYQKDLSNIQAKINSEVISNVLIDYEN